MPEISRFYGIIIKMVFDDHDPPHFYVVYNEHKAVVSIKSLSIIKGYLPPRAISLVIEWAKIHQSELIESWNLAKSKKSLFKIEPLN